MIVITTALLFLLADGPAPPLLQVEKLDVRDEMPAAKDLTTVRRIYVDVLTGGEAAAQFRDMLMASLQKTRLFIVTENQDRADAVLKGAADDKAFTDTFHSTDNLNMHTQVSGSVHSSQLLPRLGKRGPRFPLLPGFSREGGGGIVKELGTGSMASWPKYPAPGTARSIVGVPLVFWAV